MNIYCVAPINDIGTRILFRLHKEKIGFVWKWENFSAKSIKNYTDRYGPVFVLSRRIHFMHRADTKSNFLEEDLDYGNLWTQH
jgi:hypothetical protein